MTSLLRKLKTSSVPPVAVESEESISSSYDYSCAVVYNGPPLATHSIPEIPAFKIDQIPIAAIASYSLSNESLSVPVIQPLGKSHHNKKLSTTDSSPDNNALVIRRTSCSKIDFDVHDHDDVPTNSDDDTIESESGSTRSLSGSSEHNKGTTLTKHAKRPSAVTFRDPESNYMIDHTTDSAEEFFDSHQVVASTVPVKPRAVRPGGKKGSCYKCLQGNRLTAKEVCIVCSAKYCRSCLVRAMGSMPEGRKCVTCIGYRIDERKRRKLGRGSSRILKKLLSELIVAQIMDDERSCEANQILPELIRVNLQPLDRQQLMMLLNCRNPPKQLNPGSYWYDKASGYWGKVKKSTSNKIT